MDTYDGRAPHDEAADLVRRRINVVLADERNGRDLRDAFVLRPAVRQVTGNWNNVYDTVVWAVEVDGAYRGYVNRTRAGRQQFLPHMLFLTKPYTEATRIEVLRTRIKVAEKQAARGRRDPIPPLYVRQVEEQASDARDELSRLGLPC